MNRIPVFRISMITAIALALAISALRPVAMPPQVHAQAPGSNLYIEPGTTILRPLDGSGQVQGKVVIDLQSGDIWGFPTSTSAPYPVDPANPNPPVSKPLYLGKFDFSAMKHP